jgi:hypothetical protein
VNIIFRIRTIIAVVAGVLAIAVPAATASAATPAAPAASPTNGPFKSPDAGAVIAPFRAGVNTAFDDYTAGAQAALDGWTAGANAAVHSWQQGVQQVQDASSSLQGANAVYSPAMFHPGPLWSPNR